MENEFTRKELQAIRDKAMDNSRAVPDNHWRRAYIRLAEAADYLDAMEARTKDN